VPRKRKQKANQLFFSWKKFLQGKETVFMENLLYGNTILKLT